MGCWNPKETFGKLSSNFACILLASSSLEEAEVHSSLSFKMIIKSQASIGIGSVGISAVPIFPTTFLTSGKFASKIWDAFPVASMVLVRLVPVIKRVSTAKSPSSSEGINSAPSCLKAKMLNTNNAAMTVITNFWRRSNAFNIGVYFDRMAFTILSLMVSFVEIFFDKNIEEIIGTYVNESTNAPRIAKITVCAMGLNILPSMPTSAKIGRYTTRMMICPKTALLLNFDADSYTWWFICSFDRMLFPRLFSKCSVDSTIITAPSIIRPKSNAPKLIKFPETPNTFMSEMAINIANGMTDATMSPARKFPSKRTKTKMTIKAPSIKFLVTVEIARSTRSVRSK